MRESSLFNFFQQKINEAALQQSYNTATLSTSYRTDSNNERPIEPLLSRIECDRTKVRLTGNETEIPQNIERCG